MSVMLKKNWLFVGISLLTSVLCFVFSAEGQEVTLLLNSHFVKDHESELIRQAEEWAASEGVKVRIDFISDVDLETKITSEAQAGAGHDIVALRDFVAYIYRDILTDVTQIVTEIESENGSTLELAKLCSLVDNRWLAIPWYHQSFPIVYRKDYIEAVGYSIEDMGNLTTDAFLELAKKLADIGHPVGFPISMCPDSNASLAPFLWAFGGSLFGKDGTVVVSSSGTAKALDYVHQLSRYMPPEVIGWDNAGNNLFILSGAGALTANPPSIYAVALQQNPDLAQELYHAPFPKGPNGRYRCTGAWSFGIPHYARNKELASKLIKYLMRKDNFRSLVEASKGYNQPLYEGYQMFTIWQEVPSLRAYEPVVETLLPIGWPGLEALPTKAAVRAQLLYIMPVMFAKVVAGEETVDGAMRWAEAELNRLVAEGE